MLEHSQPVRMLEVLVQAYAVAGLAEDADQRGLAHLDWLPAQIGAVEFEQVEGIEKGVSLVPPAAQRREDGQAPIVAADDFPINQAGREAVRPVVARLEFLATELPPDRAGPSADSRRA